jgi:hypothetical protein
MNLEQNELNAVEALLNSLQSQISELKNALNTNSATREEGVLQITRIVEDSQTIQEIFGGKKDKANFEISDSEDHQQEIQNELRLLAGYLCNGDIEHQMKKIVKDETVGIEKIKNLRQKNTREISTEPEETADYPSLDLVFKKVYPRKSEQKLGMIKKADLELPEEYLEKLRERQKQQEQEENFFDQQRKEQIEEEKERNAKKMKEQIEKRRQREIEEENRRNQDRMRQIREREREQERRKAAANQARQNEIARNARFRQNLQNRMIERNNEQNQAAQTNLNQLVPRQPAQPRQAEEPNPRDIRKIENWSINAMSYPSIPKVNLMFSDIKVPVSISESTTKNPSTLVATLEGKYFLLSRRRLVTVVTDTFSHIKNPRASQRARQQNPSKV